MNRVPQTIGRVILVFAVALSLLAASAVLAFGAPASFVATAIVSYNFDGGAGQTFPTIAPYPATSADGFLPTAAR